LVKVFLSKRGENEISFSAFSDTQMAQVRLQKDDFSPNAATSVPEKSQVTWMCDWEFSKKFFLLIWYIY
jgi:hypothetical protein